ncbi:MAG: cobyrinate a,c-diamide synthase [Desulfuromonadales bacterium]|nr:cobyrinate a,c-diamide synthase [Desulfuromonadales bacterium]
MNTNGFMIAAPQSNSGKTTVSLAIMAGLRRRGLVVAPFKCGPDFIDPGYHRLASGRISINLDGWMCPELFVEATFRLHAGAADVAVIEAVMGLFDGLGSSPLLGSSAQIAAITGAPVVLVVNARGMAASAAALVKGFAEFDPRVRLAGVIFNNVGSRSHTELLTKVMAETLPEIAVFGCIPRDESLAIPSRHLGLVTVEDNPLAPEYLSHLADMAEQHLDLEGLAKLQILPRPPFLKGGDGTAPCLKGGDVIAPPFIKGGTGRISPVRIAVARDAAFCFMYEDNLRLLREAGAEIVPFSPLDDCSLPEGVGGVYLPGGYPELYAERLAANNAMLDSIRRAVRDDMPLYAECGGFIYLTQGMEDPQGTPLEDFAGVFPVRARMLPKRKALGYRQVGFLVDSILGIGGDIARGHEFHYSEIGEMPADVRRMYQVTRQGVTLGQEGYRVHNCLASYVHLHFGSNSRIAPTFVAACRDHACNGPE